MKYEICWNLRWNNNWRKNLLVLLNYYFSIAVVKDERNVYNINISCIWRSSMISYFAPIFLLHNLPVFILILLCYFHSGAVIVEAIRCYSCANDFIVWHWRHLFLKRNYGITASDQNCAKSDYTPEITQLCPSTCFIMYLNGTNRRNGMVTILGRH